MAGVLETIRLVLLLFFSISAVLWGLWGFAYRFYISRKERTNFLYVETPALYQVLFWVIVIPLFILMTWNMVA